MQRISPEDEWLLRRNESEMQQVLIGICSTLPLEHRLATLSTEERLRGLSAEELLRVLKPEVLERLRLLLQEIPLIVSDVSNPK